ncbi:diguanylate cyclase domain-containing protein [Microseira sp. BLCC-F43]|jgi:diguanylate cyclase (GGDEF)-like protein|uniref:diguanylate cyclase domain-containing protein n=1 Tax=Microseira sp. BLCC-F43 TaxID=3153602 RepID=UPI0035B912A2
MTRDALVVGINQYPFLRENPASRVKHLTTPAADAEAIAQLLETYGNFRVQRLPVSNIHGKLQVDPNKTVQLEELEAAIANLFHPDSDRTPETALLFFAGHGLRKSIGSLTQGFLATSDASPSKNLWGMSLRDLQEILQKSSVQQQIIWLDCCFSGELLNFRETNLGGGGSGCDRFFIAASRDYEVAYKQLDGEHGVLTGALLKGLDPHQVPEYEWITNQMLAVSVERELKEYYAQVKIPQFPISSNHGEPIRLIQGRGRRPLESKDEKVANNFIRSRVKLAPETINELVYLLRPFVEDEENRRALLVLALTNDLPVLQRIIWSATVATFIPQMVGKLMDYGEVATDRQALWALLENHAPVLQRITWSATVATFIPQMVSKLIDYGEIAPGRQALWALLEYVRSQVDTDLQQRIDKLHSVIDFPTFTDQLLNRAAGEMFLKEILPQMTANIPYQSKKNIIIAMADIDELTIINKLYGREVGNEVLASVANILREGCSIECKTGRCGDDTFYIFLPGIQLSEAIDICNKIRCRIADHRWSSLAP